MRLKKIQEALKTKNIIFTYTEEDNCGSLDFQFSKYLCFRQLSGSTSFR